MSAATALLVCYSAKAKLPLAIRVMLLVVSRSWGAADVSQLFDLDKKRHSINFRR